MVTPAVLAERYLLERHAGAGGMGEVWKAVDQETGQPVAIKRLPRHTGAGDLARFAREAQILAMLSHPRVVRYVAHGADAEGAPYLVMEWLDGQDLGERLGAGRLSVDESLALALGVADALSFAHGQGVVHRDLKPSNLFLPGGRPEAVKVLDFGVARVLQATRVTGTGMLMGTPGYMAPEQARGEPHVDARADVFSLGCVLFECLTGEPAFGGDHATAILAKVLFEETPSARSAQPEVPEALDALLKRMLAKEREGRPADGGSVVKALQSLGQTPTPTTAASVRAPALTSSEQRPVAVILVGAPADAAARPVDSGATLDSATDGEILREAKRHGGASERLLDGSLAVVLSGSGAATDLCAQAARCALALREPAGDRLIALAMGQGERTGRPRGPAIDRSARLLAATLSRSLPKGAVVIDEVVAGLLDARFDVREAEGLFSLHGERALAESTRLLMGRATPYVGRERELSWLRTLFAESAEEGVAQAVLVTAAPGVGKSRLAQEFLQELRARGEPLSIWAARGDVLAVGSPFAMLGQAIRSACGIREGEPLEARRRKLSAQVEAWVDPSERRRVAEFLGEIAGAPFPDEDSLPLRAARRDAQLMADQARAAFLDFVTAACARGPVLVLLEDLHWGDRPTAQLIDAALRDSDDRPLFVLALARPEVREVFPKLWEGRRLHETRLVELHRRAGERLARHMLGQSADAGTIDRIVRLSEGNAFYLEELIRWTAESKGSDLPETVVAMVESRLGALDDEARRLLRAASVFGEVFWAGGVAALLGEACATGVASALATLAEREFLVRRRDSRFPGEEELAFRHALLREGAYAMLTDEDRTLGHRLAGAWLEARGEPDARALAEHFEKGGDGQAAGRHYLRATHQANRAGDGLLALALARRGLAAATAGDLRMRLLGAMCESAMWQPETALSLRREAEELMQSAPRGSAPWAQGMIPLTTIATVEGRVEDLLALGEAMRQVDIAADAADAAATTLGSTAFTLDLMGMARDADALFLALEGLARAFEDQSPFVKIQHDIVMGTRAGADDDPFRAMEFARKSQALSRRSGHRRYEIVAGLIAAMNAWFMGANDEAQSELRALPLADEEFGIGFSHRSFILAWLLADRGALAEARPFAEGLIEAGRARGLLFAEARGRWALAEVRRRAGDLDRAEREAEGAVAALGQVCPIDVAGALATLAAIRLAQGRPAEALAAAEEGASRHEALRMCSHFFRGAFLRLTRIESLLAAGQPDAARASLAEARDRLLAIAGRIPDPSYRAHFLEDVPENRRTLELARERLGGGAG